MSLSGRLSHRAQIRTLAGGYLLYTREYRDLRRTSTIHKRVRPAPCSASRSIDHLEAANANSEVGVFARHIRVVAHHDNTKSLPCRIITGLPKFRGDGIRYVNDLKPAISIDSKSWDTFQEYVPFLAQLVDVTRICTGPWIRAAREASISPPTLS